MTNSGQPEATTHTRAACEHLHGFNRTTLWGPDQVPAETASQLADLAALTAALPQALSQLAGLLEQAKQTQQLSMDQLSSETDPSMAIDVARLHLDEARHVAVDLHKLIDSAHQASAHVVSEGASGDLDVLPDHR